VVAPEVAAEDATDEVFPSSAPMATRPYSELRVSLDYPEAALTRPTREPNMEALDIHWVIPDFLPGAGGHMTIFRIVKLLAQFGHRQTLWIQNPSVHSTPKAAHQTMEKHFLTADAEFRFLPSDMSMIEGDAIIASDRWTAFPVAATKNFFRRFYFVQDYETYFYPAGSHALLTDFTYSLGFDCLCAGNWLKRLMGEHGLWTMAWELATDDAIYFNPLTEQQRDPSRIAFYSRITTTRRAVELGLLALEELARWGYKFGVDFYGAAAEFHEPPYSHQYHGILSPMELGNLYRKSALGLVFSSTNYSLVPREMMACRLPVVELDVDSVRSVFPEDVLVRVAPHPTAIAEGIANLLDNQPGRQQLADRALEYQKQFSWERSARLIESALRERIGAAASGALDNSRQYRGSPYRACNQAARSGI
jgi:glycosyltransferase involved in cell wall biosynthesis